ncbi:MAG TPA: hypothetical protein VH374_00485 [Polyangia bacterium]|jgi:hypothetical protein|nr:hypothetical protein [Polyangia bacterium]
MMTGRLAAGRKLFVAAVLAGGLLAGAKQAAAQGHDNNEKRPRPPIRASATVEVIDPAHGVDEIISRVRDQKGRRGDGSKDHTNQDQGNRAGGDDDSHRGGGALPNATGGDRETLPPPDKNDRPSYRPDRDRRDPRRQDGETRLSLPNNRTNSMQRQQRR